MGQSVFAGIEESEGFGGGVYFEPGNYVAQILECRSGETRDGDNFFVVEFDVLDSNQPMIKVGTQVSWFVKIMKDTPALKNIKTFISKAMECQPEEVTQAGAEMIVGPAQPLRGITMRVRAKNILTKKKKETFTVCDFALFEGTADQVKALRMAAKLPV